MATSKESQLTSGEVRFLDQFEGATHWQVRSEFDPHFIPAVTGILRGLTRRGYLVSRVNDVSGVREWCRTDKPIPPEWRSFQ